MLEDTKQGVFAAGLRVGWSCRRLVVCPDGWYVDIWVRDVLLKGSLLLQNWKFAQLLLVK